MKPSAHEITSSPVPAENSSNTCLWKRHNLTLVASNAHYTEYTQKEILNNHLKSVRLILTGIMFKDPARTAQSTHSISVIQTSQLMLCREIIAVCYQIHIKHINTLRGLNVELLNVKAGGTYSDH
jgi:hypothetical protein